VVPAVTPTGFSPSRTPRTLEPTPFNEGVLHYADTVRAFVAAFDAGRYDDAIALIDERFLFGGDCDYDTAKLYRLDDRESVTYWLRSRIADHDRIDIVRFVELQDRGSAIGVEIVRTSDTIRSRGYAGGSVRPRVPLFVQLTLDGLRIGALAYVWSTPTATFSDCLP
jgi:hypothetical protein